MFERIPEDRAVRIAMVDEFLADWTASPAATKGYSAKEIAAAEARLGLPLPESLSCWYRTCGAVHNMWTGQDKLVGPDELELAGGRLEFLLENQDVYRWFIRQTDLTLPDPPVFVTDHSQAWQESPAVSVFALQLAIYSAFFFEDAVHGICLQQGLLQTAVSKALRKIDLPPWSVFEPPGLFWEAPNVVAVSLGSSQLQVAARTITAFSSVAQALANEAVVLELLRP